jgi:hypothetical protein
MTYQDFDEILEIIENSCLGKIPYDVLFKLSDGTVFGVDYELTTHITRFAIYGVASEDGEIDYASLITEIGIYDANQNLIEQSNIIANNFAAYLKSNDLTVTADEHIYDFEEDDYNMYESKFDKVYKQIINEITEHK